MMIIMGVIGLVILGILVCKYRSEVASDELVLGLKTSGVGAGITMKMTMAGMRFNQSIL